VKDAPPPGRGERTARTGHGWTERFTVPRLTPLTPAQLRLRAQVAANTRWAHDPDPSVNARRGQAGLLRRFEAEVDPAGRMDPQERTRRAEQARRAHMQGLALRSSRARAARRQGGAA
jgi:hypothetical protein